MYTHTHPHTYIHTYIEQCRPSRICLIHTRCIGLCTPHPNELVQVEVLAQVTFGLLVLCAERQRKLLVCVLFFSHLSQPGVGQSLHLTATNFFHLSLSNSVLSWASYLTLISILFCTWRMHACDSFLSPKMARPCPEVCFSLSFPSPLSFGKEAISSFGTNRDLLPLPASRNNCASASIITSLHVHSISPLCLHFSSRTKWANIIASAHLHLLLLLANCKADCCGPAQPGQRAKGYSQSHMYIYTHGYLMDSRVTCYFVIYSFLPSFVAATIHVDGCGHRHCHPLDHWVCQNTAEYLHDILPCMHHSLVHVYGCVCGCVCVCGCSCMCLLYRD